MKYNEDFLHLINNAYTEVTSSKEEIDKTFTHVMNKTGLKKKPHLGKKGITLLTAAAVIAASAITVVAYQLSIKDSFPEVFNEQNSIGQIVPVEKNLPLIEEAGSVINQTVVQNDVKVTVNGVVGDSDTVYLSIDVEDINGKPLQTSDRQLKFNSAFFRIEDGRNVAENPGQYCWTERIDNGSIPSKATFLINEKTLAQNIIGKKASLVLTNLEELDKSQKADTIGMTTTLYDIYSQITPAKETDIVDIVGEEGKKDENGVEHITKIYSLPEGTGNVPLSDSYKNVLVNNMGFKDGTFFIKLNVNADDYYDDILTDVGVKNTKTGVVISGGSRTQFSSSFNSIPVSLHFPGISSPEDLKNCTLITNMGPNGVFSTVREGEWKFEFDLSYKNTTKTYNINKNYTIGSAYLNIQKISLSPISMTIIGTSSEVIEVPAKIIMKDGSVIDATKSSGDKTEQNVRMSYILQVVVDVDQIKSVKVGNADILIS